MIALSALLAAGHAADTLLCRDGATRLTYALLRARTLAAAQAWRTRDARRFALCLDDPFDFACALFAVLAAGRQPVIPANATPGHLAALAGAYDAVLTADELHAACGRPTLASVSASAPTAIDPQAPLTLFTSGSSGVPKAVHKTLAQFDAEVRTLEAQWGELAAGATMVSSVPHHHIYGLLFRLLWPLAAGRPFERALCLEPAQLQARLGDDGATLVIATPAQLARWPALTGFDALAPAPRAFFSSGGPLDAATAARYAARFGAAPIEVYGSTETGGIAWRRQHESPAWQALPGIELRRDEDGALALRSPHLGHAGWHRSDDAVHFDEAHRFTLLGRLDRVVKLAGKRVSLPEMEARLAGCPGVAQAVLAPLAGGSREQLGALVALDEAGCASLHADGRVALTRQLRRYLGNWFEAAVLPRRWRFRTALPFDARGKLPAAAVAAAFAPAAAGFELLSESVTADEYRYELRVPRSLVHFDGHFPGLPILPGVVQVDWAIRLADARVAGVRALTSLERLKFMAPVPPGALLELRLAHDTARRRVRFAYRLRGRDCASGVIVYREPA